MEINKIDPESQLMIRATLKFSSLQDLVCQLVKNAVEALADYVEVEVNCENNSLTVKDNGRGFDTVGLSAEFCQRGEKTLGLLQMIARVVVYSFADKCFSVKYGKICESRALNKNGTVIVVQDLFYNVPVRRFEFRRQAVFDCLHGVEEILLTEPEVSLRVKVADEVVASYEAVSSVFDRLVQITGCLNLKQVRFYGNSADIEGYVSEVNDCIVHKKYQFVLAEMKLTEQPDILNRINTIFVEAQKIISKDQKSKKFPVFFLNFSNKKTESSEFWSFESLADITLMLKEQVFPDLITQKLFDKYLTSTSSKRGKPEWLSPESFSFSSSISDINLIQVLETSHSTSTQKKTLKKPSKPLFQYKNFEDSIINTTIKELLPSNLQKFSSTVSIPVLSYIPEIKSCKTENESLQISSLVIQDLIGQVDNKFIAANIIVQDSLFFTVFDQHASHERVRLEELIFGLEAGLTQEKCKIFIKLTGEDLTRFSLRQQVCEKFGFLVKKEAENYYLVRLPVVYGTVLSLGDFLITIHTDDEIPKPVLNALKFKACRSAVKFGDFLKFEQAEKLVSELSKCKVFNQCAHGRPTFYPLIRIPETRSRCKLVYTKLNKT